MGALPPWTPFAHPRGLRACQRFGPHSWRGDKSGLLSPSFKTLGAHLPCPLGVGAAPSTPTLIKVGEGRPFSKRLTSVGVNGAHPPDPRQGACAPLDPLCPPPLAEGLPAFWVPLVVGVLMGATRPLFWFCGGTPPTTPCQGASPPWTPRFAHPRELRVHQSFGSHSWWGC